MSFDASSEVHLRSSLSSTPDAISSRLLTMTFTTAAFGRSRSWRFGASSCKAAPRDLPSSNAQHRAPSLLLDTRNFLNCIADHALHVDRLRSQIDLNYTKLAYFKRLLLKPLGLNDPVERVPDGYRGQPGKPASLVHGDPLVQSLIDKFFRILDLPLKLKELRRDVYRKVSAIKRCWFGWLSTREAEMATALDAVVVRENATFLAVPNDDPKYMGRTFNKMLNNGARAIYEAIASAKLAWLGIPKLRIPSPYTSKADLSASSVYETKRRGEDFVDASGKKWHADEHAGLTIAAWLLLRKMSPSTAAAPAAAVEAEQISEFL